MLNSFIGRLALGVPGAFLWWLAMLKFLSWIGIDFPPSSGIYEFLCIAYGLGFLSGFVLLLLWVFRGSRVFQPLGRY